MKRIRTGIKVGKLVIIQRDADMQSNKEYEDNLICCRCGKTDIAIIEKGKLYCEKCANVYLCDNCGMEDPHYIRGDDYALCTGCLQEERERKLQNKIVKLMSRRELNA